MLDLTTKLPQNAREILGDLTALASELGGTDSLGQLPFASADLRSVHLQTPQDLQRFMDEYRKEILIAHELPAVYQAFYHTVHGRARELTALDQRLCRVPILRNFASASFQVGQTQLRRLRPLRSERVLQRYLNAVDSGEAKAWHTLVFGLVLGVYSLPLRQGLVHFAHQTLGGFVQASSRRLDLSESECDRILSHHSPQILTAVEELIAGKQPSTDSLIEL